MFIRRVFLGGVVVVAAGVHAGPAGDRDLRVKEFAVMGYTGILADAKSGGGPYLRTLGDLLGIEKEKQAGLADRVRSLSESHPNIMDFAEQATTLRWDGPVCVPAGEGIYSGEQLEGALNHLTKGMAVAVFLKSGEKLDGQFVEYASRRLWVRGAARRSVHFNEILAVKADRL